MRGRALKLDGPFAFHANMPEVPPFHQHPNGIHLSLDGTEQSDANN
jgi:hypothetical protein